MANRKRIQQYLAASPFPTLICDGDRKVIFANEAMPDLCGYSVDKMIGMNPGRLLQGEESDPLTINRVRKQLDAGVPFKFSITNYHEEGHKYHVGVFVIPFLDGNKSEQLYVGVSRELESADKSTLENVPPGFATTISQVLALVDTE